MTIGDNIKRERKKIRLKQSELAEALETDISTISRWENNKNLPNADSIAKIAQKLNVPVSALYGEDEPQGVQQSTPEPGLGLAYWGQVADNMQKLANSGNIDEINAIYSLLNIGFNALAKTRENNSGINITQSNIGRDANIKIERSN